MLRAANTSLFTSPSATNGWLRQDSAVSARSREKGSNSFCFILTAPYVSHHTQFWATWIRLYWRGSRPSGSGLLPSFACFVADFEKVISPIIDFTCSKSLDQGRKPRTSKSYSRFGATRKKIGLSRLRPPSPNEIYPSLLYLR